MLNVVSRPPSCWPNITVDGRAPQLLLTHLKLLLIEIKRGRRPSLLLTVTRLKLLMIGEGRRNTAVT